MMPRTSRGGHDVAAQTSRSVGPTRGSLRIVKRGQVPLRGVFLGGQGQGSGGAVEEGVDEAAHGGFGEVAAFAVVPFFVLFEEDGADEAGEPPEVSCRFFLSQEGWRYAKEDRSRGQGAGVAVGA